MVEDVKLAANGVTPVFHFGRLGGIDASPDEVVKAIEQLLVKR